MVVEIHGFDWPEIGESNLLNIMDMLLDLKHLLLSQSTVFRNHVEHFLTCFTSMQSNALHIRHDVLLPKAKNITSFQVLMSLEH